MPGACLGRLSRRSVLAGGAVLSLAGPSALRAGNRPPPRLAAIDWAMLETALALGHPPVAATELIRFRTDFGSPASGALPLPGGITDLGLRGAPNFELLQLSRPNLILSSPYYTRYHDRLASIAPVLSLPFFVPGENPWPKAIAALHVVADRLGDPAVGRAAAAAAQARMAALAGRLAHHAGRPLALIQIGDARHLRAFGFDSLFGGALTRLGLANAWAGMTEFSFMAPVPIERLASLPDARLVVLGRIPPFARRALSRSLLWQALPQVKAGRVHQLPDLNAFGGVPSGLRFAELLAGALDAGGAAG